MEGRKNSSLDSVNELKQIKERVLVLKKEIANKQYLNFKEFNIRNLKIFGHTCNYLMPFVVALGMISGGFAIFGGGLPFRTDKIIKYKLYNLDLQSKAYIIMNDEYRTNRLIDAMLPSNKLIIYTPWEIRGNEYIRYKRDYNLENLVTLDLFNAIVNKDYAFIKNNLKNYKEEIQVSNTINEQEDNDYFIEASLHMFDEEDKIIYDESVIGNILVTIVEIVSGIGIGALATDLRDYDYFDYLCDVRFVNRKYHLRIKRIKPLKKELEQANKKILSLSNVKKCRK